MLFQPRQILRYCLAQRPWFKAACGYSKKVILPLHALFLTLDERGRRDGGSGCAALHRTRDMRLHVTRFEPSGQEAAPTRNLKSQASTGCLAF